MEIPFLQVMSGGLVVLGRHLRCFTEGADFFQYTFILVRRYRTKIKSTIEANQYLAEPRIRYEREA